MQRDPNSTMRSNSKNIAPSSHKPSAHKALIILNLFIIILVILGVALLKKGNKMTVEADIVNLRSGPGLNYKVTKQVAKGASLSVLKEDSSWYQVALSDGTKGWVASWLIKNKETTPATNIAATVNTKDTKLRESASTDSETLATLAKNTKVIITLEQSGWSQVTVNDKTGWIKTSLLTVTDTSTKTASATKDSTAQIIYTREDSTNLREQANIDSRIVATLEKNVKVTVLATEGDWFKVKTADNKTGYVANWVMNYASNSNPLVTSISEATIMLDAGHGGNDTGAETFDGQYAEKDLTLSTVEAIKTALEKTGAKVILTRSDDTFVDLVPRSDLSNQLKPDVFISIHYDSTDDANIATGTHTYYYRDFDQHLAETISDHLSDLPLLNNGASYNDLSVTRENTQPALLLELGYLSTDSDVAYIITKDFQKQVATAITSALTEYFQ